MKRIYLDNAATTRVYPEVVEAMIPYFTEEYGNPSNEYSFCKGVRKAVDESRCQLAQIIGADPFEIYFTSGGSESDNWALKGAAELMRGKGNHIITSKIEHHAVLKSCEQLEKQGYEVTYLDVDDTGMVDPDILEREIRPTTILISVMYANNEIGVIQQIREIGRIARDHGILFHTDAVQAFGHTLINVRECNISLLSASAHKIGGPKGVGFLFVDRNVKLPGMINGGGQENGLRAGTLNTPGIVGFACAARIAGRDMESEMKRQEELKGHLIRKVLSEIPDSILNSRCYLGLPNIVNFSFGKIDGSALLFMLEQQGVFVSAGSACTAAQKDTSHVLRAIGVPKEYINGTVRISLSRETTEEEVDYTAEALRTIVNGLRGNK